MDTRLRRGTAWVGVASGLAGTLDLLTTLACLWLFVSPAELGVATMASALFPVLDRVATLGLGQAAVRSSGDRAVMSTIFWTSLAMSLLVLGAVLLLAPAIGALFDRPVVGSLMALFACKIVTQNAHLVPEAQLRREMHFSTLSKVRIVANIADTIAKLGTAYIGAHGHPDLRIYCFVAGPVASSLTTSIGLQLCAPWRPAFTFHLREALAAVRFGSQLSVSELIYFAYTSADYVVIGRAFGDAAVGAYRLAYEMVLDVVRLVSMVTGEVAFSAFVRLQGDRARAGELLVRFTRQNLVLVAPALIVIAVAADDLLAILYPPLGPAAATAVRILSVVGAVRAASFVLPPMLAGLGHSRDALVYNVVAAIVCPSSFVIAAAVWPQYGYLSVAWAWGASYPIAFALLLWFALVRTRVAAGVYVRALAPIVAWSAVTATIAALVRLALPASIWIRAAGVIAVTAACYGVLVLLVRRRLRSSIASATTNGAPEAAPPPPDPHPHP